MISSPVFVLLRWQTPVSEELNRGWSVSTAVVDRGEASRGGMLYSLTMCANK